ncbi:MAG: ATP-binding protein [Alphaproteobacteria bacterium]
MKLFRKKISTKELDALMDFYWGGSERRITGLTLRIIAVNAIAPLILVIGILYLGQTQNNLIEAKLETFRTETELLAGTMSLSASNQIATGLDLSNAEQAVTKMGTVLKKHIRVFNYDGSLFVDSRELKLAENIEESGIDHTLYSIRMLKKATAFIINLLPNKRVLPTFDYEPVTNSNDYPDTKIAMSGIMNISAWNTEDSRILLIGAAPIKSDMHIRGVVMISYIATDIEEAILQVWFEIIRMFLGTLCVTILLSIYLSGVIARPLKKLITAAENIRSGQSWEHEIPDLRSRHDEIGELSIVLRNMTDTLRERMQSIEKFAADVAHELKNPLTSLKSAIETLSVVKKAEDRQKLIEIIEHDITRLDRLITDISAASRLDTELSREVFKPIDLTEILVRVTDTYQKPLDRKAQADHKTDLSSNFRTIEVKNNIVIQLSYDQSESFLVNGSDIRLEQAFNNIVDNALSFSKPNSVIKIEAYTRLNSIVIRIEDEGPGIPESKLENIFDRFYSERPDHEAFGQHSGLGLYICKQIVEAHKGRIFAENIKSPSGKTTGARFTIILRRIG